MKNVLLLLTFAVLLALTTIGFQCSSAEMTSARMYMNRSEWANAEHSLEQEVAKTPNNAEAWYLLGRVRLEMKNYKGMNDAFSHSLAAGNQHEKDIKGLRLSVWGLEFNAGVETYLKAKKMQGDTAAVVYQQAIDHFDNVLLVNTDSAATYTNKGLAYLALDNFDEAASNFETSMKKEKDPSLASSVASMYLDRGRKRQAMAQFSGGASKDSLIALAKKDFDKSIATLEMARQWDPENTIVVGSLLDAYVAAGRSDEAMKYFRQAVEKSPNNKLYRYNYGVLLLKAGNHKGAIEQFEAAVVIDSKFEDALYNLGVTYLQWGAKLRAESDPTKTKNKQPDKSSEEQFRKGKDALERLRDLKPNNPETWEALGQSYANLNMQKQATEAFTKVDNLRKRK